MPYLDPSNIPPEYPKHIRDVRANSGLNRQDFALSLRTSDSSVSCWEAGARKPPLEIWRQVVAMAPDEPPEYTSDLGKRLLALRHKYGLSAIYVGDALSVSEQTISRWEHGIDRPTMYNSQKILDFERSLIEKAKRGDVVDPGIYRNKPKHRQAIIAEYLAAGNQSPLLIMLKNMQFFDREADKAYEELELAKETTSSSDIWPMVQQVIAYRTKCHECARDAASYFHPKLANVTIDGDGEGGPVKIANAYVLLEKMANKSDVELARIYTDLIGGQVSQELLESDESKPKDD